MTCCIVCCLCACSVAEHTSSDRGKHHEQSGAREPGGRAAHTPRPITSAWSRTAITEGQSCNPPPGEPLMCHVAVPPRFDIPTARRGQRTHAGNARRQRTHATHAGNAVRVQASQAQESATGNRTTHTTYLCFAGCFRYFGQTGFVNLKKPCLVRWVSSL